MEVGRQGQVVYLGLGYLGAANQDSSPGEYRVRSPLPMPLLYMLHSCYTCSPLNALRSVGSPFAPN